MKPYVNARLKGNWFDPRPGASGPLGLCPSILEIEDGVLRRALVADQVPRDRFIFPAFVNAHSHLELSRLGCLVQSPFPLWLPRVGALRALRSRRALMAGVRGACSKLVRGGTAIIGDIQTISGVGSLVSRYGLGGVSFTEIRDGLGSPILEQDMMSGLSIHTPYSCPSNFAIRLPSDVPLQIHLGETRHSRDNFAWLKASGLSDSCRLSVVHGCYLTEQDLLDMAEIGVGLVLCPSNLKYFRRCIPQVELFLDVGGRLAIGTDSVASGSNLSMLDEMRLLRRLRPTLSMSDIFYAATYGGARVLGLVRALSNSSSLANLIEVRIPSGEVEDLLEPSSEVIRTIAWGRELWRAEA